MTVNGLYPWIGGQMPLAQITPFTYREGATLLHIMREFERWLRNVGVEVDEQLTKYLTDVALLKEGWQKLFEDFMADVVVRLEGLNDQAVANLVEREASKLRVALDGVFANKAEFITFKDDTTQDMLEFKQTTNEMFDSFTSDVNAYMETTVTKNSLLANVKDFGAKGDNTTDDTAAVQRAVDHLKARGGGRLYFPAGDYYIRNGVYLTDNLEIFGDKATLRKKSASDPTYCIFIGSSGSRRGYGSGPSNLYLHDLAFRGKYGADARGLCVMALHHSDNVVVERVNVAECSGGGHRFDLQACRYVTIRDSVFRGFDGTLGSLYNEDIQADFSSKRSGSFLEADVNSYDGLTSQFITVENNKWLPLTIGGFTYPAANPFGTHGTLYQRPISDLVFRNNYVENPVSDNSGTGVPGTLAFVGVKNVVIEGNKIVGDKQVAPAIAFYQGTGGQDPDKVQTDDPSISYSFPMRCENVVIRGNEITGFTGAPSIIRAHGSDVSRAFDIEVSGNTIYRTNESNGTENAGPLTIHLVHCQRVKVDGNSVRESRRFAHIQNCLDVAVNGNNLSTIALNDLTLQSCNRVAVNGNSFNSVVGYGVYSTDSTAVVVAGNTFASRSGSTQPMVQIGGARQFTVCQNSLTGFSATFGIYIVDSTGVIMGNTLVGFTTPITPATTTGGVQVGLNGS